MSRKNRSKYASKNYQNLYKYPSSPFWQFEKYTSEKGEKFKFSTKEAKNEAKAYKIGQDAFSEWLGRFASGSKTVIIRDLAIEINEAKSAKKKNTQRSTLNQIKNHIIPNFGHLRPDQMNSLKWDQYDSRERVRVRISKTGKKLPPRTKLFNTRKALIEIMNRAEELGYINRVPEFRNHDAPPAPPVYLEKQTVRRILKNIKPGNAKKEFKGQELTLEERIPATKLLAYIMWRQGPGRPKSCSTGFP